ncbi:MAG: AAA domain-containing protein [Luteitalea sp.]|nr:AAA domain-containing protein [Luteitalea sp.]
MPDRRGMSETAVRLRALSAEQWGEQRALDMIGLSPALSEAQAKVEKIARYREPVLITGESGSGKELFAQAIYLLGPSRGQPFVAANCPQYQEGDLTVSELFGHTKGSFTGAVADRKGAFEEADGGVIFLDEIADLRPSAQMMLLRALSTGEIRPLGATRSRSVDVRVVSATNGHLNHLVATKQFRFDLLFRLRQFHIAIPPLRERGDDWRLLTDFWLDRLAAKYGVAKRFSAASLKLLGTYDWPGNVRQLIGVVKTGYAMADDDVIEPAEFVSYLEESEGMRSAEQPSLYERIVKQEEPFWTVVYEAFIRRDLNRSQVRGLIKAGLNASGGNYRRLLELLRLPASDYQRFMDFLRHHDLKP